jgi:hypothetical protein
MNSTEALQGYTYAVDLVLCIDGTGSMGPIIDDVKRSALSFHDDLTRVLDAKHKRVDSLRIRVVTFRDFYVDGAASLEPSGFFTLPDEREAFAAFVSAIAPDGGGDEPESGLEALGYAMLSDWAKTATRHRHVVVMWTDAGAHPLEGVGGKRPSGIPNGVPKTFDEITDMWEGGEVMNDSAKRLILYAPDAFPWSDIGTNWSNVIHHTSKAGKGLSDVDFNSILDQIAQSV